VIAINNIGQRLGLVGVAVRRAVQDRLHDDRGEGVISMAIAVLIIATIGGVIWIIFNDAAGNLDTTIDQQILDVTSGNP